MPLWTLFLLFSQHSNGLFVDLEVYKVIYNYSNVSFIPSFCLLVSGIVVTLVAWISFRVFRLAHLALQNLNKEYVIFSYFRNFIAKSVQKPKMTFTGFSQHNKILKWKRYFWIQKSIFNLPNEICLNVVPSGGRFLWLESLALDELTTLTALLTLSRLAACWRLDAAVFELATSELLVESSTTTAQALALSYETGRKLEAENSKIKLIN